MLKSREYMSQKDPNGILNPCIDCQEFFYWWPMNGTTGDEGMFWLAIFVYISSKVTLTK